jgi:branched-chain amino acid transport system permease protein
MAADSPDSAPARTTASGRRHAVASMTPFSRYGLMAAAVVLVLLAFGPTWLSRGDMRLVGEICIYIALAQMWNLLAGYAGLVSVGQQAYVGLGAYTLVFFSHFRDAHPLLGVVLAGVIAGLLAIPTAAVVFRLKGAYFAIGTWVVAEVFALSFAQLTMFGGGSGMSAASVVRELGDSAAARSAVIYWLALGLAAGSIGLVYAVLRSRFGLALAAIRDSEPAAESLGVDTANAKYVVYVAAAVMTGLCGAVIALTKTTISPSASFAVMDWTAYVIFIVVIGGVGRIEGPIIGTIVYFILRETIGDGAYVHGVIEAVVAVANGVTGAEIPAPPMSAFESWGPIYLIILGLIGIAIMLVARRGLWGLIVDRFGLELFPIQRRLVTKDDAAP